MTDPDPNRAWMRAWQDHAAQAAEWWRQAGTLAPAAASGGEAAWAEKMRTMFTEQYRRTLTPAVPFDLAQPASQAAGALALRCQRAFQSLATLAGSIATDASRRFAEALSPQGPETPPITTLRALHDLWVECGEAAWAAAVHRDDYAIAQAEWIAALAELALEQRRLAAVAGLPR